MIIIQMDDYKPGFEKWSLITFRENGEDCVDVLQWRISSMCIWTLWLSQVIFEIVDNGSQYKSSKNFRTSL